MKAAVYADTAFSVAKDLSWNCIFRVVFQVAYPVAQGYTAWIKWLSTWQCTSFCREHVPSHSSTLISWHLWWSFKFCRQMSTWKPCTHKLQPLMSIFLSFVFLGFQFLQAWCLGTQFCQGGCCCESWHLVEGKWRGKMGRKGKEIREEREGED